MAKAGPSNQLQKVEPSANALTAMPDYLKDQKVEGLETLKQYVVLPRLKIVQKTAEPKLKERFAVGSVCLVPTLDPISENAVDKTGNPNPRGPSFKFVPLFFFASWAQINDIKKKGAEPTFLYFTLDPNDPFVAKCRDKSTREEKHPRDPNCTVRNVEMLNYVVLLRDKEGLADQPVIITFSRASYMDGSNFAAVIKKTNASIYSRIWEATPTIRSNNQGDWFALEITQPSGDTSPWVSKEEYEQLKKIYGELSEAHMKKGIRPDTSDDASDLGGTPTPTENNQYA